VDKGTSTRLVSDLASIRFDLSLDEADRHYLYARTKIHRDEQQESRHDETAVRYCLLGVGHIRLKEPDLAERRLLFAEQLDPSFADPPLLLASLAARSAGTESPHLDLALRAQPDCLKEPQVQVLLWLLGVPRKRRDVVATKGMTTRQNLEQLAWAIECQDDEERNKAKALLATARKRLGF
jgi:hypothetical protein